MKHRVLVIAAHPDDEVLGCGGTMAWHAAKGDRVCVLILGEGATARHANRRDDAAQRQVAKLRVAARAASKLLRVSELTVESFPDNQFDTVPLLELVKVIERVKTRCRPDTIYTHHAGDVNVDHRRVHHAVIAACRPQPQERLRRLYGFEVLSSTEWAGPEPMNTFRPDTFVSTSKVLPQKIAALKAYRSELRRFPHPRSVEGVRLLARYRGMSVGLRDAEAFMTIRHIDR